MTKEKHRLGIPAIERYQEQIKKLQRLLKKCQASNKEKSNRIANLEHIILYLEGKLKIEEV